MQLPNITSILPIKKKRNEVETFIRNAVKWFARATFSSVFGNLHFSPK